MPPKTEVQKFIGRIKLFLKQADITAPELAESLGFKKATLRCWLNCTRNPSDESIVEFQSRMMAFRESVNAASAALDNFFAL